MVDSLLAVWAICRSYQFSFGKMSKPARELLRARWTKSVRSS